MRGVREATCEYSSRPMRDSRLPWPAQWKPWFLGIAVRVACLEDTTQGTLWAYGDPKRRFSKREKDELDLIRLAETWPDLRAIPRELLEQIDRG